MLLVPRGPYFENHWASSASLQTCELRAVDEDVRSRCGKVLASPGGDASLWSDGHGEPGHLCLVLGEGHRLSEVTGVAALMGTLLMAHRD